LTFYLNQAKVVKVSILVPYILSTIVLSLAFLFPLGVGIAISWTTITLIKKKVNTTFFSLGISIKQLLPSVVIVSSFLTIVNLLYFEFAYPKAAYINRITYLESKNKPIHKGIVKNFWYRNRKNTFVYFQLVDLQEKKAFNGQIFKVDKNYNLIWVTNIPIANFLFRENRILIQAKDIIKYFPSKVKKLRKLSLEFKYNKKLLKVKEASFFSLLELYVLIKQARFLNINKAYYLWELEKRLLLTLLSFWIPIYTFLRLFKITDKKRMAEHLILIGSLTLFFILFIVFYQTLVNKISLNPLYGTLIIIPYLVLLIKEIRKT